ncbi:MAG: hypothetical protein NTV98_01890 [Candidatus Roizmanbacteria bacterium]|nr:hypothetical protein [Candidatus Roizmanbacteria bacterium]
MAIIYEVDTDKEVTPTMVKDAIIRCFCIAHSEQAEMGSDKGIITDYCITIVSKAFEETGGDITNPTKESLLLTVPWLANYSKNFRDQSTIQKHMEEIKKLISFLKD